MKYVHWSPKESLWNISSTIIVPGINSERNPNRWEFLWVYLQILKKRRIMRGCQSNYLNRKYFSEFPHKSKWLISLVKARLCIDRKSEVFILQLSHSNSILKFNLPILGSMRSPGKLPCACGKLDLTSTAQSPSNLKYFDETTGNCTAAKAEREIFLLLNMKMNNNNSVEQHQCYFLTITFNLFYTISKFLMCHSLFVLAIYTCILEVARDFGLGQERDCVLGTHKGNLKLWDTDSSYIPIIVFALLLFCFRVDSQLRFIGETKTFP